jgi:hypothetical protein
VNLVDVARYGDHTLHVPITIDDVEPAWLTAQLRSAGYSADVASFTASPIGNGMMASSKPPTPTQRSVSFPATSRSDPRRSPSQRCRSRDTSQP